ncbi:acyltransferase [Streptococcus suis]|uniref:acyltransferase n=1 Tax=Streptococcus suis TaxID=1307 RepID=UPI00345B899C
MKLRKILWWLRLRCLAPIFGKVGKSSYLASSISIIGAKNIFIGDKVRIFPGNRMETYNNGSIHIGDNCSIGQNFHVISDENRLIIGKNTTISGNVFITNTEHDYKEIGEHILNQRMLTSETQIGENCFIGFGASIQAGTVLGKQCIVGTNAVVRGHYPDYSVIVGVPAKAIKRYNEETGDWEKI